MGNSQGSQEERFRRHTVAGSSPETATSAQKYPEFLSKLAKILVTKTIEEENLDGISESVFQRYLFPNYPVLAKKLFAHLKQEKDEKANVCIVSKETFLQSAESLLQYVREDQQITFYIKLFAEEHSKINREDLSHAIRIAFQTTGLPLEYTNEDEEAIQCIVSAILHGKDEVTVLWASTWIGNNTPNLLVNLHQFVMSRLTSGYSIISSKNPSANVMTTNTLSVPVVDSTIDPVMRWLLTSSLPFLYTRKPHASEALTPGLQLKNPRIVLAQIMSVSDPAHWHLLYDSNLHGLSMIRLKNEILTYRGPTLMFVKSEIEHTYCIASDVEWRESHQYWGCDDCRLLETKPSFQLVEGGPKMVYFNLTTRGYPFGIHVGKDFRKPSIKIDQNLNIVHFKNIPSKIMEIQVFGCGRTGTKEAQEKQKKWENQQAEKQQRVNIACNWNENPDRYLLELGTSRQSYSQHYTS